MVAVTLLLQSPRVLFVPLHSRGVGGRPAGVGGGSIFAREGRGLAQLQRRCHM